MALIVLSVFLDSWKVWKPINLCPLFVYSDERNIGLIINECTELQKKRSKNEIDKWIFISNYSPFLDIPQITNKQKRFC